MTDKDRFLEHAHRKGVLPQESLAHLLSLYERHQTHPIWQLALSAGIISTEAVEKILAETGEMELVCSICARRFPDRSKGRKRSARLCPTCGTTLVPCTRTVWAFPVLDPDEIAKDPLVGTRVGPYRIDGVIGQGGMANVYRATSVSTGRTSAVKVLTPSLLFGAEERYLLTFLAQARRIAQLRHQNILRVRSVEEHASTHLVVMEYLSGGSLTDKIRKQRRIRTKESRQLVLALAKALSYGHKRGVLHLDIKPANVLFTSTGVCKLTDFSGISPKEHPEFARYVMRWATPAFMSPEQAARTATDARSDVYSLGLLWATMLVGRHPYKGLDRDTIRHSKVTETCPVVARAVEALPREHANVLDAMSAISPDDRYPSMKHCIADLAALK